MASVLITGGSRGIGAAAVRAFAARGDQVTFLYEKNHEAAQAVAKETGATAICADISDHAAVAAAFAGLRELDVLVNNAGICHYGLLSQTPEAVWDRIFAVNVRGTYLCTQAAIPLFLQKHRGAIINVSSMWGQVGASCEAAYSASKGAILALTKALAKELGPSGIRVNAVAPGVILTDMVAHVDPAVLEALREETHWSATGGRGKGHGVPGRRRIYHRTNSAGERRVRHYMNHTQEDQAMKISLACDHGGLSLKLAVKQHLEALGHQVEDFGTHTRDSCDYSDFAAPAAQAVAKGQCERGIVICTTGIGVSITANKVKGIRCALLSDLMSARLTRQHNDANMMALGAGVVGEKLALEMVDLFLTTPFEGGRHARRVDKVMALEEN